jgi:enolase
MHELKVAITDIIMNNTEEFSNEKNKIKYYIEKYPKLSNEYPMIFKKACEPNFDFSKFVWMTNMVHDINKNEITQHDASVKVGERLVDEYVKPLI